MDDPVQRFNRPGLRRRSCQGRPVDLSVLFQDTRAESKTNLYRPDCRLDKPVSILSHRLPWRPSNARIRTTVLFPVRSPVTPITNLSSAPAYLKDSCLLIELMYLLAAFQKNILHRFF